MYRLILLFLFVISLDAIEIDLSIEKNLAKDDINNRLILAKYYLDKNITKSKKFVDEVFNIDKQNKIAKQLDKKIKLKEEFDKKFKGIDIDKYYQTLFFDKKYDEIKKLSKYLPLIKSDYPKLITAKIYFWDGDYKKTKKILKLVKDKNNQDYLEIEAYMAFYNGNYYTAKRDFGILYNATGKLEYAYKLIDTYLFLDEIDKANKLIYLLLKKDKNNKKLLKYKKKISSKKDKEIKKLYQNYQKTGKFEDLQKLIFLLLNYNQQNEAYTLLEEYIQKHPSDKNAKYWYATYLSWGGDNKKALKILEKIVTDDDYKTKLLMAKIYSWNGEYDKAINYLNDIITNSKDKNLIIDAKETKGLIYYWQQNYKKAKPLLEEVLKNKSSMEAKEALMVMNGNIIPLIKKYKLLSRKNPTNLEYLLKVAQYSESIKDIDTAIEYYEKYYNLKPDINVAHSLAKLYLIKKNPYKAFSYYEYWAYQKGDVNSLYELAEQYYYAGYSKSALSVINDILDIDKKYKKALKLKAKILRYSPKFTQENSKKTISDIFEEKNSKLLTIANRLYFNGFYYDASKYYKEYLLNNPNDVEIRERYAYSLQFSDDFRTSSGEFFLLTWHKKDCNILYNYAIALKKTNKLKQAKKALKEALNYAKKPLPEFIKEFINEWKKAWESQDINEYKKFYIDKYRKNPYWAIRKENIFKNVKFISLYFAGFSITQTYKKNDKDYYKVKFFQQYTTNKKSDKGYKTLLLECKNKKCLIAEEKWQKGEYIPTNYRCYNLVLKELNNSEKNITKIEYNITLENNDTEINLELKELNITNEINETEQNVTKIKPIEANVTKSKKVHKNNTLGFKWYYYNDKPDISLIDNGIFYKNSNFYVDLMKWRLWDKTTKRDGKYLTFHYNIDKFVVGIEAGNYENNSYLYPYVEYKGDVNLKYFHSITGKDKKSICAVDNNTTTKHFVITKYKGIKTDYLELTKYWWSIDISQIDENLEFTPQFQYNFEKDRYKSVDFYYYVSGWYQYNSNEECYYSPDLTDANYLEVHPVYKHLRGVLKGGYSFLESSLLYGYGLFYDDKYIKAGCMKNHSYRDDISNYWYLECTMQAKVEW